MKGQIHNFVANGQWHQVSEEKLRGIGDAAKPIRKLLEQQFKNGIAYFKPHDGESTAFMNDRCSDLSLLTAANQTGKTIHGSAWSIIRCIPCNPNWPIFTENGVEYHEWEGPKDWVVGSFTWDNVAVVWEHYKNLLPREELGLYAPQYGKFKGEIGNPRELSFNDRKGKSITLKCGTRLIFKCFVQREAYWESSTIGGYHMDEQVPKNLFLLLLRGAQTIKNVQGCMTMTGSKIKDRPDTGAGGWIKREIFDEEDKPLGLNVGKYKISLPDVPEAIIDKEERERMYIRYVVNPEKNNDQKMKRVAMARYWGGWEPGGGLVLDSWDEEVHVLPDIDIPLKKCTLYRGADHGKERPMAVLNCAITPWGDMVGYNEYYKSGMDVHLHVPGILEMCGNTRRPLGQTNDGGVTWETFEECMTGQNFYSSVLDSRSFSYAVGVGPNLGQFYNDQGLYVTPASGKQLGIGTLDGLVPRMLKWLDIDPEKPHIMHTFWEHKWISDKQYEFWLKQRGGNYMGGAKFYILHKCRSFRMEAVAWEMDETKDKPKDENDHLVGSAWKYIVAEEPAFHGPVGLNIGLYTREEVYDYEPTGYRHI